MERERRNTWIEKLSKALLRAGTIWSLLHKTKKILSPCKSLSIEDNKIEDPQVIANTPAYTFLKAHELPQSSSPTLVSTVQNAIVAIHSLQVTSPQDFFTNSKEVTQIVRKIKNSKSPGIELTSSIMLKYLPRKGFACLTSILKACVRFQYFPDCWKQSKIIPIYKNGKSRTGSSAYRTISLLSHLSSVLEKIVQKKLLCFLDSNHVINPTQYGFRSGHSTTLQLLILTHNHYQVLHQQTHRIANVSLVGKPSTMYGMIPFCTSSLYTKSPTPSKSDSQSSAKQNLPRGP